jgi:uncharacterized protein (TIGR02246 family)
MMKRASVAAIAALISIALSSSFALAAGDAESQIRALEDQYTAAVNAKDVDKIMACYVPDESLFVFDVIPPRQYVGAKAYHKDWEGVIAGNPGPMHIDIQELVIAGSDKLATSHMIQHFIGTDAKGQKVENNFRVTDVYRKVGGKWLIAQEHVSLPVDLVTLKADPLSKP